MRNQVMDAMLLAKELHKNQKRKYTHNPYFDHLAEVAGITATALAGHTPWQFQTAVSAAWLHDSMEDQGVTFEQLYAVVGPDIAAGVWLLSDLETGNRAARKAASRERLARAPGWVQTIKCADLISNTSSIVEHDPSFARVYLEEKRLLLDVMTEADPELRAMAYAICRKD